MSDNKNDILHVEGGKPLNGTIKVRGAKNFVSKAMVAALLAPGTSVLKNVPEIRDVHVVSDLLRLHGVDVTVDGANGVVTIDATNVQLADVADVVKSKKFGQQIKNIRQKKLFLPMERLPEC